MKGFFQLTVLATAASALTVPQPVEKFHIEVSPGNTTWVTENEKWNLRRQGVNFFDITNHDLSEKSAVIHAANAVTYPDQPTQSSHVQPLLKQLDKEQMRSNLETFSNLFNRYYKSDYGRQSSEWLLKRVQDTLGEVGNAKPFKHSWGQNSIIATIPGKSAKTIIIGAHQDSINLDGPMDLRAPGADDDGSGTVTTLEALRVLLTDDGIRSGQAENTIEFHWYSAEEGGLLGSSDVFKAYQSQGRDVKAMFQQDMTGYNQGTLDAGKPDSLGVITDYVDSGLTDFIKKVVNSYCTIPYVETECGYACSDHASANKAGYPSAFVIESDMKLTSTYIHSERDTIDRLDFDHMIQHGRLTLGLAYELAHAKL
ncbi:leucine aminopeptidase 2 [Piedraia hortae CBS 480.64]|uniref:Peptide hydrolase n=1 Tax=Piedraia hortae CBS 480.64 TaxID=1314780 RepID=A0A6A7BUP3_9PEZI|nr:leucine aminopeptidase 2 [Piedraia hortae CBS 480.64]